MARVIHWALLTVLVGLAGGVCLSPARAEKKPLAKGDFEAIITEDLDFLREKLASRRASRARSVITTTALMIGHYADEKMKESGADKKQLATLRNRAIDIARAAFDKDFKKAKELAAALKVNIAADPSVDMADLDTLKAVEGYELYDLMTPFRRTGRANGRDYEKFVKEYAKALPDAKQGALLALRMSRFAELTKGFAPKRDVGKKTKANWLKFSGDMEKYSDEAAAALLKGNNAAAVKAFGMLDASCTNCHNVFRN